MELDAAIDFARSTRQSVLTTVRASGRPQLSNVFHHVFDDGLIRVSITTDRAKYHNLVRDPWAALHVTSEDFWKYTVIEAAVELTPVATQTDDATVEELVLHYRELMGEHKDWQAYREAMVSQHRVVVRLTPVRAYGTIERPARSG